MQTETVSAALMLHRGATDRIRQTAVRTHLALVDGDGPGQFEWQLLSTQVYPTTRLEHPALWLQHFRDATQEANSRQP